MAQSITLQTSDSDIVSSDVLGRLSFAASSESSGSDAVLIGASIYAMAESNFTEISNATSIIFATASSESAIAKLKISSQGHFLPILDKTYDIGASGTKFRNVFAENGKCENISISNLSDPYEILYITDSSGNVSSTDLLKIDLTNSELDLNADIIGTGNISINGNIIANTGSYNALTVNSISVSISGHTHTASDITNFNSSVSGLLPVKNIFGGNGVSVSSVSGEYTISASGLAAGSAESILTTCFNNTGATLSKGTVVYINGRSGNLPTVQKSIATNEAGSSKTYGIVFEDITDNHSGSVIVIGALTSFDTNQFSAAEGSTLYLSPSVSGTMTATKPSAPNHLVSVGKIVRNHNNQGIIQVIIQNGFELQELHNVALNGTTNGQFLQYSSASGLWVASSSGNFSTLQLNGTTVSVSGHTHTSSDITNFNSSVSGLLPTIANSGDNRILTSTGSSVGINAESNLTFVDGYILKIDDPTNNVAASLELHNNTNNDDLISIRLLDGYGNSKLTIYSSDDEDQNWIISEGYPLFITSYPDRLYLSGPSYNYIDLNISSGIDIDAPSGINILSNLKINNQTASTIASFDSSKNLVSLSTVTYPSLTELSYVKGVTSALQTQIDTKAATSTTITAGSGLAGGGSLAANRTIDIGQGDGITVSADSIAVDSTVIRTTGVQTMSGAKTFSAQTVFASGTAAAPGISILDDTDTGIGQLSANGTNSLSIMTSGVERVTINSAGNVGIGTSSPTFVNANYSGLHIHAATATSLKLTNTTTGQSATDGFELLQDASANAYVWNRENTFLSFATNSTERMRITSGGNLEIKSNAGNISTLFTYNENGGELVHYDDAQVAATLLDQCNNQTRLLELINGSDLLLGLGGSNTTGSVRFMRAGFSEIMRINSSGNIGIGSSTNNDNIRTRLQVCGPDATDTPSLGTATGAFLITNTDSLYGTQFGVSSDGFGWIQQGRVDGTATAYNLLINPVGGNVGIGTSLPTPKLHVYGAGSATNAPSTTSSLGATIGVQDSGGASSNGGMVMFGAIQGFFAAIKGLITDGTPNTLGDLIFTTRNATGDSALTERVRITSGGNFGIGSGATTPPELLSVMKDNNAGRTSILIDNLDQRLKMSCYYESGVGQYAEIQSTNNAETGHQVLILNRQGGNVGIGTSSPSTKLQINGQTRVTDGTTNIDFVSSGAVGYVGTQTNHPLALRTNDTERLRVGTNGRTQFFAATEKYGVQLNNSSTGNGPFIGSDGADIFCISTAGGAERLRVNAAGELLIGTTTDNGAYLLQVNSQIYATNATIATSDSRFKTNVVSINNATSIIQSLRPVSFDFIPQTDRNFSSDRQIGLIAQEVQEVLSNTDYKDSIVAQCGDHLGLAYEKLVPLLIKALQETNQELQNIKNRLSALEGE